MSATIWACLGKQNNVCSRRSCWTVRTPEFRASGLTNTIELEPLFSTGPAPSDRMGVARSHEPRTYLGSPQDLVKTLKLWVRRKPVHRGFECSGCGRRLHRVHDVREREIRDLPWSVYRATVVVEVHRVRCPECGVRGEKMEQLPSKAPFSKRFEEIIGQACESAAASQVA